MTTATTDVLDDEAVVDAMRGLRIAGQRLDDARRALHEAKDAVAVALHRAAAPYRAQGATLPWEALSTLYWDRPEIRAKDIADAFGVRVASLGRLAGPRTQVVACRSCDGAVEFVRRSRSSSPHHVECDECQLRREIERQLRIIEEEERRALEHARWEPDRWEPYGPLGTSPPYPLP
jgi:hypothetical protein